ncbi:transposase [Streptomyces sp. RLB1-33]
MWAVLYVNHTRIPWEYLPHDFPPYKTVYDTVEPTSSKPPGARS